MKEEQQVGSDWDIEWALGLDEREDGVGPVLQPGLPWTLFWMTGTIRTLQQGRGCVLSMKA